MPDPFYPRRFDDRPPTHASLWMQWFVVAVALLFGTVSTAQAAHLHRPAPTGHFVQAPATGTPNADTEEHCPICVAIHATLPAPMLAVPSPVTVEVAVADSSPERIAVAGWHFALLSRPPPFPLFD